MFTGIIEELGIVKSISRKGNTTVLSINAKRVKGDIKIGESIAVNGVCLTVVKIDGGTLVFELLPETIKLTNLCRLKTEEKVNLERSLRPIDRLSGHFVTGHVDCIGVIRKKTYLAGNLCFEIAIPAEFLKFIVPKGAVSVDGIGLTVVNKRANIFNVYIIPHTLKNTTLGFKGPSSLVNIECDILAKYQNR